MTEAEWLVSENAQALLTVATRDRRQEPSEHSCKVSDRKLRLFSCAVCRQIFHLLKDERSRNVVEVAERFADALTTEDELFLAWNFANEDDVIDKPYAHLVHWVAPMLGNKLEQSVVELLKSMPIVSQLNYQPVQASLLRDIVGNPFKPLLPKWKCVTCGGSNTYKFSHGLGCSDCYPRQGFGVERAEPWLYWNNCTVAHIAQSIYVSSRFEDMPILADSLQDAGYDNEDVLAHLRNLERCPECPSPSHCRKADAKCEDCNCTGWRKRRVPALHARGCHVLDFLLGKS